jgi:hypothetical protein
MLPRPVWALICLVIAATAVASSASARGGSSAPPPPLPSVALASSDFRSGGAILSQTKSSQGVMTLFLRVFKPGAKLTGPPLLSAVSLVMLEPDAETATTDYKELNGEAQSIRGRNALAKVFTSSFVRGFKTAAHGKAKLTVRRTVVGEPSMISATSLHLPVTLTTNLGTYRLALELSQIDRVIAVVYLAGQPNTSVTSADAELARSLSEKHVTAAFTVGSAGPPTIAGSASVGQTVAVDEGAWTGGPSRFDYVWTRCDASGASCVPIYGATARTYVPTSADVGYTLRAAVTGANSVTSLQATSAATAIVV